ncbi:MAG: AraC family transcriptional regulator [Aquabacterium sp.]|nr:MAG: AraC family transcriptional regulator [Aquabacterium sp.]
MPRLTASPTRPSDAPAGSGARIVTWAQHRISTLTLREDALVLVRQGRKSLIGAGGTLVAERGQVLLVARGTQWDVVNDPAGQPCYEALALGFGDALVREQWQRLAAPGTPALDGARVLAHDPDVSEAAQRAARFLQARSVSEAVQRHRLAEVLLLLAERGLHFRPLDELGWDDRVRRLVAQRPEADWSVETLAGAFNLSASTLRRRLDGCGASVAALVREVRLEVALALLQTTRRPIGEIAQRCGWESHSRFTAAFQERWGFAPSVLRAGPVSLVARPAHRSAQDD